MFIIDEIIQYYSKGPNYKKLIAPIIIKKDNNGNYNSTELLNRLAYTIIDQQRDVASIIIPIWANMMFKGINPDFLAKSPYATELVQSILKAYGHQNYHSKSDFEIRGKRGASRTDAFVNVYKEYNPDEFLNFIKDNSNDIKTIFDELINLKYISLKSASFFLRDIEGFEYDILPIDVNVAYSFQYTGLFFREKPLNSFNCILNEVIPVSRRTNIGEYSIISNRMQELCSKLDYNPYELNRYLFLLGADFCQSLKCDECFIREPCFFNNLPLVDKEKFIQKIKSH